MTFTSIDLKAQSMPRAARSCRPHIPLLGPVVSGPVAQPITYANPFSELAVSAFHRMPAPVPAAVLTMGHHSKGVVPMAIEDIKQLRTVNGITQAQGLLDKGWVILAVCVMQDGTSQYAEYHLGFSDQPSTRKSLAELGATLA